MAVATVLTVVTLTGAVQAWHVLLAVLVTTAAATFDQPSRQALVPALVPRDQLPAGDRAAQPLARGRGAHRSGDRRVAHRAGRSRAWSTCWTGSRTPCSSWSWRPSGSRRCGASCDGPPARSAPTWSRAPATSVRPTAHLVSLCGLDLSRPSSVPTACCSRRSADGWTSARRVRPAGGGAVARARCWPPTASSAWSPARRGWAGCCWPRPWRTGGPPSASRRSRRCAPRWRSPCCSVPSTPRRPPSGTPPSSSRHRTSCGAGCGRSTR